MLRLLSLKHTTVYNSDNDLTWEYETDWTRSASSDMRAFSPDVRKWTQISFLYITEPIEVADEVITSKVTD